MCPCFTAPFSALLGIFVAAAAAAVLCAQFLSWSRIVGRCLEGISSCYGAASQAPAASLLVLPWVHFQVLTVLYKVPGNDISWIVISEVQRGIFPPRLSASARVDLPQHL